MNDDEQRFNDLYDGIEVDYDKLIEENEADFRRDINRGGIIMAVWMSVIIALVVAGFYFDLYTVS